MNIKEIIEMISKNPQCIVNPPKGLPNIPDGLELPADIKEFYSICGGIRMFDGEEFSIAILPPEDVMRSDPVILGFETGNFIADLWYVVADDENGGYVTVDLAPERFGRCYDSFHENHVFIGATPIIAMSFSEFLLKEYEMKGRNHYWLEEDFEDLGDAYDEVDPEILDKIDF